MSRIKHFFFVFAACFLPLLLSAQDVPVDLVTGAPTVYIPLHALADGGVTEQVGLSYSANGMKVSKHEQSGTAGLGWSLQAGGSISREVRGLPDDYSGSSTDNRRGWLYSSVPSELLSFVPQDNSTCPEQSINYTKLNTWYTSFADTEADVFYFQCGNYSGKFMLDNNKQWQVIPYQDVSIQFNSNSRAFTLTTGDGMTYNFTVSGTTKQQAVLAGGVSSVTYFNNDYQYYKTEVSYASTWKLTEAVATSGRKITYTYSQTNYSSEEVPVKFAEYGSSPVVKSQYKMKYSTSSQKLTSIKADQTEVVFTWGSKYISQIKIYNHANKVNPLIKEFNFSYAGSSSLGTAYLRKVVEQSSDCVLMPPYVFDYFGADLAGTGSSMLPLDDSDKKDLWGYYNENTTSEVPTIYVYDSRSNGERFRIEPILGVTPTYTLSGGSDRKANPQTAAAGMLTKVTYPGGGQTSFTYELSDYYDPVAGTTFYGGGVRVKQVRIHDGHRVESDQVKELDYKALNGQSSGRLLYPPSFVVTGTTPTVAAVDDLAPENSIFYERVGVRSVGAGKTVYTSEVEATYPLPAADATMVSFTNSASYDKDGKLICLGKEGNTKVDTYAYPYVLNGDNSYLSGQLKNVSYYDEQAVGASNPEPLKEEEYVYTKQVHGNLVYIRGLRYERVGTTYIYGYYTIVARRSKVLAQETIKLANEANKSEKLITTTNYIYSGVGDSKLLSLVQSTDSKGQVHKRSIKYSGDFLSSLTNPDPAKLMDMALNAMKAIGAKNIPVEEVSSVVLPGGQEKVLAATLTTFQPLGLRQYTPAGVSNFGPLAVYALGRGSFTPASITSGTYTSFNFNTQEYLVGSKLSYDPGFKQVVNTEDNWGNVASVHYGYDKTLPVAEIVNARAEQVVYESFEAGSNTGYNAGITGTGTGWTGEKSWSAAAGNTYSKAGIKYSDAPSYRFMCRTNSNISGSLTVELVQGGVVKATTTVTYPGNGNNTWELTALTLNSSGLTNADFELRVKPSAAVLIDDITFFPASAAVTTSAFIPGIGKTAVTDTRGMTTFYQYDQLGQLTHVVDQDRNIRERKTYSLASTKEPIISANFYQPSSMEPIYAGTATTFTSIPSACLSGQLQFKWYVNGQLVSGANTNTLTYTFPAAGTYFVKHEIIYDGKPFPYEDDFLVQGGLISVAIQTSGAPLYTCGGGTNNDRILKAVVAGCNTGLIYRWEKSTIYNNYNTWETVGTNSDTYVTYADADLTRYRCVVIQGCGGPSATSEIVSIQHDRFCDSQY
ncbi:hypothetical protein H7F15_02950 [Pontibacter sp. Tf4]|uniref:hypothetical protein n=1 Tax=Pontibacter sp. Tf4 TaxID=2761620 RepID=UPI0016298594|nr:hypothetical protein [Pontibacter sp. Tf4]MBB6609984.1 hypothetical protein [Pontibacter sp. Tf4]